VELDGGGDGYRCRDGANAAEEDDDRRARGMSHLFFLKKTRCISYVCQDHNFTHMIDK
jgi:hypothetical protein